MESPAATAAPLTQQPGSGLHMPDAPAPEAALRRQPATKHYSGILRFPAVRQLLRFTGVGIVCTVTSLALYALLRPWLGPQLANASALIITSVMNTALNRRLTFKIAGRGKIARDHLSGLVVIVIALVITGGSLGVLHWLNPDATMSDELWTTTLSGFLATAVRFALLRHWIFRRARHR